MPFPHRQHVRNVFHHEGACMHRPTNTDKFLVESIPRVREIAWSNLAKSLTRRPAIDDVDRLNAEGLTFAAPLEELGNVPLVEGHFREICRMCLTGLSVR